MTSTVAPQDGQDYLIFRLAYLDAIRRLPVWNADYTYTIDDVTTQSGILYKSLQASNVANDPASSPAFWEAYDFGSDPTTIRYTISNRDPSSVTDTTAAGFPTPHIWINDQSGSANDSLWIKLGQVGAFADWRKILPLSADIVDFDNTFSGLVAAQVQAAIDALVAESRNRAYLTESGSGLSGGGDQSSDRSLAVDITNTVNQTSAAGGDFLILEGSGGGHYHVTLTNLLSSTGFVPTTRLVDTGSGLSGGSTLANDLLIELDIPGLPGLGSAPEPSDLIPIGDINDLSTPEKSVPITLLGQTIGELLSVDTPAAGGLTGGNTLLPVTPALRIDMAGVPGITTLAGDEDVLVQGAVGLRTIPAANLPGGGGGTVTINTGNLLSGGGTGSVFDLDVDFSGAGSATIGLTDEILFWDGTSTYSVTTFSSFKDEVGDCFTIGTTAPVTGGGLVSSNPTIGFDLSGLTTTTVIAPADLLYIDTVAGPRAITGAALDNIYVQDSRQILAGTLTSGGGDLSADRTISFDMTEASLVSTIGSLEQLLKLNGATYERISYGDFVSEIGGEFAVTTPANSGLEGGGLLGGNPALGIDLSNVTNTGSITGTDLLLFETAGGDLRTITVTDSGFTSGGGGSVTITAGTLLDGGGTGTSLTLGFDLTEASLVVTSSASDQVMIYDGASYERIALSNLISSQGIVTESRALTGGDLIGAVGDLSADRTISFDLSEASLVTTSGTSDQIMTWDGAAYERITVSDFAQVIEGELDAAGISFTATGDVAATDVQAAIAELDTEKVPTTRSVLTNGANSALAGGSNLASDPSLSVDIDSVSIGSPANGSDYLIFHDTSASGNRKVLISELLAPTGDFKVQRGIEIIASSPHTVTYPDSVDSSKAFPLAATPHRAGQGANTLDNSVSRNSRDIGAHFSGLGSTGFTMTRASGHSTDIDLVFPYEVLEYTGAASGANEVLVLASGTGSMNTVTSSQSIVHAAATNQADKVQIITSISGDSATQGFGQDACSVTETSSTSFDVTRGTSGSNLNYSYSVLEFSGSNWTVHKGRQSITASGTTTVSIGASVSSWENSFILVTGFQAANTENAADDITFYVRPRLGTLNSFEFFMPVSATANGAALSWAVIENPDITVEHLGGMLEGNESETSVPLQIAPNYGRTLCLVSASNDGVGIQYTRPFVSWFLSPTGGLYIRRSRTGNGDMAYQSQVIHLP